MSEYATLTIAAAVLLLLTGRATGQESADAEVEIDDLEVTMTLLPADGARPEAITRTITLPPAAERTGADDAADRGAEGREIAEEARDRGREFGQEMAEQARENREDAGRGGPPEDPPGPPDDLPNPPDNPSN